MSTVDNYGIPEDQFLVIFYSRASLKMCSEGYDNCNAIQ